ncbi:unnamed protein product [Chondrus crispus]|uniref:Uncharacterized protein n=1 Tax=Chondrus crispus TaxID=2769 RepID=R7QI82_CHOCR|nr:unnamed protein product [Chondrus crispus]CDF37181.1 unnamed protein product [Chondrus crispus]|eukprot:XP_005717000.1 unnamed protein product [Chondrus crispus]
MQAREKRHRKQITDPLAIAKCQFLSLRSSTACYGRPLHCHAPQSFAA